MKNITIICDRCGLMVDGTITNCPTTGGTLTTGYYVVSDGNWKEFARWDEELVCQKCMEEDPKYIEIYK